MSGRGGEGGWLLTGLSLGSVSFLPLIGTASRAPRSRRQVLKVGGLEMCGEIGCASYGVPAFPAPSFIILRNGQLEVLGLTSPGWVGVATLRPGQDGTDAFHIQLLFQNWNGPREPDC